MKISPTSRTRSSSLIAMLIDDQRFTLACGVEMLCDVGAGTMSLGRTWESLERTREDRFDEARDMVPTTAPLFERTARRLQHRLH